MLENLSFSLNRVMPYFALIVLGAFFKRIKLVPESFFAHANRFVFLLALPMQLFMTTAEAEVSGGEGRFMLYVFAVTVISYAVIWIITELLCRDKSLVGTVVQGSFRGNFVLLGAPIIISVAGPEAAMTAALTTLVAVLCYNVLAVVVLTARGKNTSSHGFKSMFRSAATNPLIIAALIGMVFMRFGLRLPYILNETASYISQTATPLGLISIGGALNWADASKRLKPALYASAIKTAILPLAATAVSILLGYRGVELLCVLVLTASPAAFSSYSMAVEMGGDPPTASNILIITTFLSAFALAAGIYLLRAFKLIAI
jgi:predicted permease